MSNFKTVEEAKAFLTEQGYYTDNLWSVEDVQTRFKCTDDEAQEVLDQALSSEGTMEQIWFDIDYYAVEQGLINIEDND
jgi:hypothetical protein